MPMSHPVQVRPRGNPEQILATVWQRNLPLVRQRVQTLREAADALQAAPLPVDTRAQAADVAHKLAGSLGMFGYPRGTEIARNLELLLDSEAPLSSGVLQELTMQLEQALKL